MKQHLLLIKSKVVFSCTSPLLDHDLHNLVIFRLRSMTQVIFQVTSTGGGVVFWLCVLGVLCLFVWAVGLGFLLLFGGFVPILWVDNT